MTKVFSYNSKDKHSILSEPAACMQCFFSEDSGDIYMLWLDNPAFCRDYGLGGLGVVPTPTAYNLHNKFVVIFKYFKRKKIIQTYLRYMEEHDILKELADKGTYKKYAAKFMRISSVVKDVNKDRVDANYLITNGDLLSNPIYIERNINGYDELLEILRNRMEKTKELCVFCGSRIVNNACEKCHMKDERHGNVRLGRKLATYGFGASAITLALIFCGFFGVISISQPFIFILFGLFFVSLITGAVGLDKMIYKQGQYVKAENVAWEQLVAKAVDKKETNITLSYKALTPVLNKKGNPVKEKRNCDYCGKEFTHSLYGNFAVYCPHCKKLAYETDERGFWYVTPFAVSIGEEQVAGVTHEGRQAPYILRSEKYNLNINLKNRYVEALNEALEIVEKYIEK